METSQNAGILTNPNKGAHVKLTDKDYSHGTEGAVCPNCKAGKLGFVEADVKGVKRGAGWGGATFRLSICYIFVCSNSQCGWIFVAEKEK